MNSISELLQTGLVDPTLVLALAGLLWTCGLGPRRLSPRVQLVLVVVIALGSLGQLTLGIYRSYTVPRDVMQDIIAAEEFAAGRPMHPPDMNVKIGEALEREGPRYSLLESFPTLATREAEQKRLMLHEHWVQAHPPAMTLFTVPFVSAFGILGTQIAYSIIGIFSLAVVLQILHKEFWPAEAPLLWSGVVFVVFGWEPVVTVIRLQQPGLMLLALAVLSWHAIRNERTVLAGVLIATASLLKIVPAIVLIVLSVRKRSTFLAALGTLILAACLIVLIVPWSDLQDYHETTQEVIAEYAAYPANISLLGALARVFRYFGMPFQWAKFAWQASAIALVAGLFRRDLLPFTSRVPREFPLEYNVALGLSLIPILSPVAWDHYEIFHLVSLAVIGCHRCRSTTAVGFWSLIVCLAIPDQTYIWAMASAHQAGLPLVEYGLLAPFRAYLGFVILGWLYRLRNRA